MDQLGESTAAMTLDERGRFRRCMTCGPKSRARLPWCCEGDGDAFKLKELVISDRALPRGADRRLVLRHGLNRRSLQLSEQRGVHALLKISPAASRVDLPRASRV